MKQENFITTGLYIQRMVLIYGEFVCIPPIFYFNHHMFTFVFLIKKVLFIFFVSEGMFCSVQQRYWTSTLCNSSPVTIVYIHWARKTILFSLILILSKGIQSLKFLRVPTPMIYITVMVINGFGDKNLGRRFLCQLEQTLVKEIIMDPRMACLHSTQAQVNFQKPVL